MSSAIEASTKRLDEMSVGDRIAKFGYLPRRGVKVFDSIIHEGENVRFTFHFEATPDHELRGFGKREVVCEMA